MDRKIIITFCLGAAYMLGLAFFWLYPAVMFVVGLVLAAAVAGVKTGYTAETPELEWLQLRYVLAPGLIVWASCIAYVVSLMAPILLFAALSLALFAGLYFAWTVLFPSDLQIPPKL